MGKKEDFLSLLNTDGNSSGFWQDYHKFCKNLETVDVDIFFNSLPQLLKRIENDVFSRELMIGIEDASFTSADFGNNLYHKITNQEDPNILRLLPNVLSGLYKTEKKETISKIKRLIQGGDSVKKNVALQSIAKFESESLKLDREFLEFIENEFNRIIQNGESKTLWPTVLFVCRNKRDVLNEADGFIRKVWNETNIEIQLELIYLLSYNLDINKEETFYIEVLHKLIPLNIEYKGAYSQLSYALSDITKHHTETIINFLNKWVAFDKAHANNIQLFEYPINSLIDNSLNTYEELITNWLNNDNPNFHIAVFNIMRANHIRDVFDLKVSQKSLKDMSIYDVKYITYKILSYIYDKNISTSMVYSILESKINEETIVNFLNEVFVTYFIFNYYGTIEFLRDKKKDAVPKLKKVIDTIITEGEKSYNAYSELDFLKEFSPSERRLSYFHKIQNKKFNKSFKGMEKNDDSFLSHIKNIQLKAGKTSFSKYMNEYSKQLELTNISSSAELPRGEFIDPIGQKKLRLTWQNHKRQK